MKPKSVLQRMTLLGFMLMTMSINAFANNANEEKKNSTKVVVEKSVSRSILDPNVPIVLSVGEETGWLALPEFVGYECTSFELALSSDPDCVTVLVNDSLT